MKSPREKHEERIKWLSLRNFPNGVKKFSETTPSILQESTKTNRQWKFFLASTRNKRVARDNGRPDEETQKSSRLNHPDDCRSRCKPL